jgi:hypothetical protein
LLSLILLRPVEGSVYDTGSRERVPLTGGFVARTAIQYFNVNVALLAGKLDEWAAMPDEGT